MTNNKKLSSILSGVAGEYLVAGELSRRGIVASVTLRNTMGVDIIATNEKATKTVNIQVKTNQNNAKYWLLNQKAESYYGKNLFYVFVNLNNGGAPEYFVVSSIAVAKFIKENHQSWLNTPGKKGKAHKDTAMRQFKDNEKKYLNKWELLGVD